MQLTPGGEKDFRKIPPHDQKRVLEKIKLYLASGHFMTFAKPLINLPPATHRFRVGKYRVSFYLHAGSIVIDAIDLRKDAYRR